MLNTDSFKTPSAGINVCATKSIPSAPQRFGKSVKALAKSAGALLALVALLIFAAPAAFAQGTGSISGTVTDSLEGSPLPGVNVVIAGTQQGASTGAAGQFTISGLEPGTYDVQASFVGYENKVVEGVEVTAGATVAADFALRQSTVALEEVVAIGYGTQQKADVTGSVSAVGAEEISELSVSNPLEALRGRASGVNVTQNNGKPGTGGIDVKIRGIGSINNTSPLVIVDGVRRSAEDINPEDIASVDVLKDAASAAIYGAQAANGVILITTKSGQRNQDAQVNFKARVGARNAIHLPNTLGTPDFLRLGLEARRNDGRTSIPDDFASCADGGGGGCGEGLANTNWMKEVFSTGLEQAYDLSISGGTSDLNYYISGSYEREEGFKYDETFDKYTLRINSDFDLTDAIRIGETVNLSRTVEDPSHGRDLPMRPIPVFPVRDPSNPLGGWGRGPAYWAGPNPVGTQYVNDQVNTGNSVRGNVYAEVDLLKGLYARGNFGLAYNAGQSTFYRDRFDWGSTSRGQDLFRTGFSQGTNYNATTTLNFNRSFGSHNVEALAGLEAVSQGNGQDISAEAVGFTVRNPRSLGLAQGTPVVNNLTTQKTPYRLLSQFGRVNYNYDNRYLLQLNIRRDGSSKFGRSFRWGVFPGFSAGWRIDEESFMDDVEFISSLKLRGGYGILGTDAPIGNFAYIPTYSPVDREVTFGSESTTSGYEYGGYPNPNVKWEEIRQTDLGVDVGFLQDRFSATINYYLKNTTDMLFEVTLPGSSGENNLETNIGKVQNQGLELELSWQDSFGGLQYTLRANGSYNQNEVQQLAEDDFIFVGGTRSLGNTSRTVAGRPIGSFYGYRVEGLFRSQEQVDEYNARTEDGTFYTSEDTGPGDLIFTDLNGDGRITSEDRTYIGDPWPRWSYGLNADLQYRGFDLTLFLQGAANFDILNDNKSYFENFYQDYNTTTEALGRWTPENPDAAQPRLSIDDPNGNYTRVNEYLVEDGTYLKLRHVQLGYTLPASLTNVLGTSDLRVFVSAENVFTLTGYSGTDPEVAGGNTDWGVDTRRYPQTRLYSAGVSLGF